MNQSSVNNASLTDAWTMLSYIQSDDRETWITVGMCLKSEFSDAGLSLFDDWSSTASNYNEKAVMDVWKSFKGKSRSIGTLVYLAKQYGWSPGRESGKRPLPRPQRAPRESRSTETYAKKLFLACNRDDQYVADHSYAKAKGIDWAAGVGRGSANGRVIGKNADSIIVPIRNIQTGKVQGVQCINPEGKKQSFGKVSEGALILGNTLNLNEPWFVAEGWASAVSTVFHHGKEVCACSFGKSNQVSVAENISKYYDPREIIILREVDA